MGSATERQIEFAKVIAEKLNIQTPKNDFDECREFISKYKPIFDKKNNFSEELKDTSAFRDFINDFGTPGMKYLEEKLTKKPGVYVFIGIRKKVLYIGKSYDLSQRIPASYGERISKAKIKKIMYYITPTKADCNILEMALIAENKPSLNKDGISKDYPIMFKSNLIIERDFKEIPIIKECR